MFSASTFLGLRNPFSPTFRQKLSEMAAVVGQLQSMQSDIATMIMERKLRQREGFFPAQIGTATAAPGGKPAWTYTFVEVAPTNALTATAASSAGASAEFNVLSGGRSGSAINVAESANNQGAAPFFYGTPVAAGGPPWLMTTSPFTSTSIDPIPQYTIVFMRSALTTNSSEYRYEFWAPNPVTPACEA